MPITKQKNGTVWKPYLNAPEHDAVALPQHYNKSWCTCRILRELKKDGLLITKLTMHVIARRYYRRTKT